MRKLSELTIDDQFSELQFQANTDDAVNWEKLDKKLHDAPVALTPNGHVSVLIDFANGKRVEGRKLNQLVGVQVQHGGDDRHFGLPERTLRRLQHTLAVISDGTESERTRVAKAIAESISGRILIARTWSAERGWQNRIIVRNLGSAILYGFSLLTDNNSELARKLCRCRYSKCRKFFLRRPGKGGKGASRRSYCNARHGELGDRERARERMRRNRS